MSNKTESQESENIGCFETFIRIFWLLLGNLFLAFLAAFIALKKNHIALDIAFWLIVAALIYIRYLDITRFKGETAEGEPATLKHWRRYVIMLVLSAIGLYGIARIFSHFLLK